MNVLHSMQPLPNYFALLFSDLPINAAYLCTLRDTSLTNIILKVLKDSEVKILNFKKVFEVFVFFV